MSSAPVFVPDAALWREWGVLCPFSEPARSVARGTPSAGGAEAVSRAAAPASSSLPVDQARVQAEEAKSLEDLRQAVESFDLCALRKTATNTVFADGCAGAPVMLVGEAPGADEDRLGKPFVGASGQLLDKIFAAAGWTREKNLYISNVLFWRPPGNRDPSPQELALCLPFVQKHIALARPRLLVTVGGVSTRTLLGTTEGIMKVRGRWHAYQNPFMDQPVPLMALYHPAYLLRSPGQKRQAWRDVLMALSFAREQGFAP
jgi:uracil-DNA glycosylase family 4